MCGLKDGSNLIFIMLYTNANKCFKTSDYGTTWTQEIVPPQASSSIRLMQFINPTLGFAGGAGGVFLRYGNSIGITQINTELPSEFKLGQNYPNPFNPSTTIDFSIPLSDKVTLKVYDLTGKEVYTLVDEFRNAGNYSVSFTVGQALNSGIYFYKMTTGKVSITKKFMIVK